MSEIRVPDLGESIVEATILQWLKQVGDAVGEGDAVAELETDKVNVEVIAEQPGILESVLKQAGDAVQVGEAIGVIGAGAAKAEPQPSPAVEAQAPSPAPAVQQPSASVATDNQAAHASPSVRRLARQYGVDLTRVTGTGGLGRITEADVQAQANRASQPQSIAPSAPPIAPVSQKTQPMPLGQAADRPDEERQRMSRRRLTIAKRLVEAQHTAAMLTTFNEIDMTAVMEVRKRRKQPFQEEHGISLGFMSFFTKATVAALKAFPRLNAEIRGEDIIVKHHYDIGIAVSAEGGLVVPVVRDADRLNFAEIEKEISRLAKKARENQLDLQDLTGGTFTITNGGVFGSLFSTPILNAPQVGILGMHSIQKRPVAVGDSVEIRPMMYVALSYDHRIVDGSEAVRCLVKIKQLLEDPESLLLEG